MRDPRAGAAVTEVRVQDEVRLQDAQWVERRNQVHADQREIHSYWFDARTELTLKTDRAVLVPGGLGRTSFCARIDHGCPGYDEPGLLERLLALRDWTEQPSPIDLQSLPLVP